MGRRSSLLHGCFHRRADFSSSSDNANSGDSRRRRSFHAASNTDSTTSGGGGAGGKRVAGDGRGAHQGHDRPGARYQDAEAGACLPCRTPFACMHCVERTVKSSHLLGPTCHTQETPRKTQNKMVQAHDERAHTVTEETLAKILTGRRHALLHAWQKSVIEWCPARPQISRAISTCRNAIRPPATSPPKKQGRPPALFPATGLREVRRQARGAGAGAQGAGGAPDRGAAGAKVWVLGMSQLRSHAGWRGVVMYVCTIHSLCRVKTAIS